MADLDDCECAVETEDSSKLGIVGLAAVASLCCVGPAAAAGGVAVAGGATAGATAASGGNRTEIIGIALMITIPLLVGGVFVRRELRS